MNTIKYDRAGVARGCNGWFTVDNGTVQNNGALVDVTISSDRHTPNLPPIIFMLSAFDARRLARMMIDAAKGIQEVDE